jgi:uncharacterized protein YbaP (TraB family)
VKRFFLLCGTLIVLAGFFSSCDNPASPSTPSNASVWEISKNGNSLFLGGSVHLLRAEDYPMPAAFDSAFDKSAILVLEADVDRMYDPEIQEYQKDKCMLPEGQTLQTVLNDDVYKQLESVFALPGAITAFSQYKPSMVINIVQTSYLSQNGFTEEGADLYYLAKSKEKGKPVEFLEDIKIQIDLLGGMIDGFENEYVSAVLDELPQSTNEIRSLVSEWKTGEAAVIEASLDAQKENWPSMYKTMIYDRNAAWIPKIEEYLTTEPVEFIIAGLAHLHGEDGLLIRLEKNGYTIKQLVN